MENRTLIADATAAVRSWIRSAIGRSAGEVTEVEQGWQVFDLLADRPFDLVIATAHLLDPHGLHVLASLRTAGCPVPFLLIQPFCSMAMRARVRRLAPAEIIDDWTDARELRAAAHRMLPQPTPRVILARAAL